MELILSNLPTTGKRFYANLEILRFLAALAVIFYHYPMFAIPDIHGLKVHHWEDSQFPFYPIISFGVIAGFVAVPCFWMLSGFIFFSQYGESIRNKQISGKKFFWLRFTRLYPLHIVTAATVFGLSYLYAAGNPEHPVLNVGNNVLVNHGLLDILQALFMFSGINARSYVLNIPAWSLAVEIILYAIFFLILKYVPKSMPTIMLLSATLVWFVTKPTDGGYLQGFLFFFTGGALYKLTELLTHPHRTKLRQLVTKVCLIIFGTISLLIMGGLILMHSANDSRVYIIHKDPTIIYVAFTAILLVLALLPQATGRPGRIFSFLGEPYLCNIPYSLPATVCHHLNMSDNRRISPLGPRLPPDRVVHPRHSIVCPHVSIF
jgi:peptidoglycan/LPS O-acetylase OafA/YrhL